MEVTEWLGSDNQLGIDIWTKKYCHDGETFDQWLDRISGGDADIRRMMAEKKFLFGGRILANRGLYKSGLKVTYSNCYVLQPPEDSIESIFECAGRLARTFSYGGGAGIDISKLAPRSEDQQLCFRDIRCGLLHGPVLHGHRTHRTARTQGSAHAHHVLRPPRPGGVHVGQDRSREGHQGQHVHPCHRRVHGVRQEQGHVRPELRPSREQPAHHKGPERGGVLREALPRQLGLRRARMPLLGQDLQLEPAQRVPRLLLRRYEPLCRGAPSRRRIVSSGKHEPCSIRQGRQVPEGGVHPGRQDLRPWTERRPRRGSSPPSLGGAEEVRQRVEADRSRYHGSRRHAHHARIQIRFPRIRRFLRQAR